MIQPQKICYLTQYNTNYKNLSIDKNYKPKFFSPLTFEYINQDILIKTLKTPTKFSAIIITSKNAIFALNQFSSETNIIKEKLSNLPIYVFGKATESVANKFGYKIKIIKDVSIVKDFAIKLCKLKFNSPILILSGNRRRDELINILSENKIENKEIIIYNTIENHEFIKRIKKKNIFQKFNWIIFFSPSGVQIINRYLQKNWCKDFIKNGKIKIGAIGKTTKNELNSLGWNVMAVAKSPTAESILEAYSIIIPF